MTQSVVVATNGSADGDGAVRQAGEIALARDAVVHVVAIADEDAPGGLDREAERILEQAAATLIDMGVFVQRHVRTGRLADVVGDVVRSSAARDLVLPVLLALEVPDDEAPCALHVVDGQAPTFAL